jgi:hypothetical protein
VQTGATPAHRALARDRRPAAMLFYFQQMMQRLLEYPDVRLLDFPGRSGSAPAWAGTVAMPAGRPPSS